MFFLHLCVSFFIAISIFILTKLLECLYWQKKNVQRLESLLRCSVLSTVQKLLPLSLMAAAFRNGHVVITLMYNVRSFAFLFFFPWSSMRLWCVFSKSFLDSQILQDIHTHTHARALAIYTYQNTNVSVMFRRFYLDKYLTRRITLPRNDIPSKAWTTKSLNIKVF